MTDKSNKALVLLSGGLDSSVVLSICKLEVIKYMQFLLIMDKDIVWN